MNVQAPVIACRNVWKLFGAKPEKYLDASDTVPELAQIQDDGYIAAVRDINLEVMPGEILVVMGLSGSGKSTLLRCMCRLTSITRGDVIVDNQNLRDLSDGALIELRRNKMGMVFQNFALLPHRTVLQNVAFPLEMRGQDKHARRDRALEMIRLVGLDGREDYFPRELSGGQQQRVGIARSLAIEPDIWFLDEPFSALDPLIRREMQDEFLRLQSILHKTIVFVTHDFEEALRLASRIAIMKDGEIQQCDTPDKIVLNPATEYVEKFTSDVDKAKVVRARSLVSSSDKTDASGGSVNGDRYIRELARELIDDPRQAFPLVDSQGDWIGVMNRSDMLDVLFGAAR